MLNPEFRLLDPEREHLHRLMSIAGTSAGPEAWAEFFETLDLAVKKDLACQTTVALSKPGIHRQSEIRDIVRWQAEQKGITLPELSVFGWPETGLRKLMAAFQGRKCVLVLGILDAEGIWTSGILGLSHDGIDFFTTFRYIWSDEPELASKQTLSDISEMCQLLEKRFGCPVSGVYMYKDEFLKWQEQAWHRGLLDEFFRNQTASSYGL